MRTQGRPVVVYETRPATEWILGGAVRKVSPRFSHGVLQFTIAGRLQEWAEGRGRVASEWRFWVTPPGEDSRYLVPDVAYLSYARVGREDREAAEEPHVAPNLAVEILSPSEREDHIAHKVDVYLRAGTSLIVIVDPLTRTLRICDAGGTRMLAESETFRHPALPAFEMPLAELFGVLDR